MREWRGFVEFAPAERPRKGLPYLVRDWQSSRRWRWQDYTLPELTGPIGCHFMQDVTFSGSGYAFSNGRYIREFVHTSDVGLQWLQRGDYPDNPLARPPTKTTVEKRPGLLVIGPGFPIFGHWLLDFLPRVAIAQQILGDAFQNFVLPLPADTPDWVPAMLGFFCGIPASQLLRYERGTEELVFAEACMPSFAHDGEYVLHSFAPRFYDAFLPRQRSVAGRRLCISRRNLEASTRGAWRVFETRALFEEMAVSRGYEIVRPEELSFAEQIPLFANVSHIVGEHGSGMHAALFAPPGTVVGCIGFSNKIQYLIGAERSHTNVYLSRTNNRKDERGVQFSNASPALITSFFDQTEAPEPGEIR